MSDSTLIKDHAAFIWSVADLPGGDYKQSEYGKVIMPLIVLRRLDCVLEPNKVKVLERHEQLKGSIDVEIELAGQRRQLRFTGKHALDLQTALAAAGNSR